MLTHIKIYRFRHATLQHMLHLYLWIVPQVANPSIEAHEVEDMYGNLEEWQEREAAEEALQVVDVGSSIAPPAALGSSGGAGMNFMYNVDAAIVKAMSCNTLHEWTVQEFQPVCRKHDLPLPGNKEQL